MTSKKDVYPIEHPLYESIREVCAEQFAFEYVEFGPLFGKHVKILAVSGGVNMGANEETATLTLWSGPKDGKTKTEGPSGTWLKVDAEAPGKEPFSGTHPLTPDGPDPAVAEFLQLPLLEHAVQVLQDLLALAEPTHAGLVGAAREISFDQLNEAVQDGFDDAGDLDGDFLDPEDDGSDLLLHTWCAQSGFATIFFGLKPLEESEPFTTSALVPTESGNVPLEAWLAPHEGQLAFWVEAAGCVQRMPAGESEGTLTLPEGTSDGARQQLSLALKHLLPLHLEAFDRYIEQLDYARDEALTALAMLARNALDGGMPLSVEEILDDVAHDHGPPLQEHPWQNAVDEFTRQCRLGFLVAVTLEESPHGKLNIRAMTFDPVTQQPVQLQVYWQKTDDAAEPVHWLAADSATHPAHGGDPLRPELLAGFPQSSRDNILHAIDHLHDMVHLATDVVNAKSAETLTVLESVGVTGDVPDLVAGAMQTEAIEDGLAGLNGIARLYTGSLPDRELRNS